MMANDTDLTSLNGTLATDSPTGDVPDGGGGVITPTLAAEGIAASCILAVFCVLGTVGNALAFIIYYRKREKGTSTIFILSLAITDFFTCMIAIPYSIAYEVSAYKLHYTFVCRMYHFIITFNIPLSSLILVGIGFDRYFCICHPFLHAITVPRAKVIIIILTLVSALLGVIPALNHSVYYEEVIVVNESVTHPDHHSLTSDLSSSDFDFDINPTPESPGDSTRLYTDGLYVNPNQEFLDEYTGRANSVSYKTSSDNDGGSTSSNGEGPTTAATASLPVGLPLDVDDTGQGHEPNASLTSDDIRIYFVQRNKTVVTYIPQCFRSNDLISESLGNAYQRAYASLFLVEFIILAFLYALIYRSIFLRRAWKAKRKQKTNYTINNCTETEETQLTNINGNSTEVNPPKKSQGRISAAMRDRTLYANIRTAAMLFVVTVVFVISFLPSWLMGLRVVPFNLIVFYIFYVNNVINPFIYAFMNKSFRDDLILLIKNCVRH